MLRSNRYKAKLIERLQAIQEEYDETKILMRQELRCKKSNGMDNPLVTMLFSYSQKQKEPIY